MMRQSAPYGIRPDTRGLAPIGAPAPGGSLNMPFPVSSGPGLSGGLGLPFTVDGFPHSQAVPGFPSNATHTHHYITLPDADCPQGQQRHAELGEAMLCFARNPGGGPTNGRRHRYEVPEDANTVELLEVNQLNEWLAKNDSKPGRPGERYYETAVDLLREWKLLGVLKNEVAPPRAYGSRNTSRVLNLVVQGRVATFNLWGGRVTAGDGLYFLVKRDQRPGGGEAWVILPYAQEAGGRPGPAALQYGNTPVPKFGSWVYVGKAGESIIDSSKPSRPDFEETRLRKKMERMLQLHIRV